MTHQIGDLNWDGSTGKISVWNGSYWNDINAITSAPPISTGNATITASPSPYLPVSTAAATGRSVKWFMQSVSEMTNDELDDVIDAAIEELRMRKHED